MLRPLCKADLPELLTIENLTQKAPWTMETFTRCLDAGFLGWVILQEESVVGFIITTLQAGESHILNLCVHPKYQRQGLGRQLLEYTLNVLQTRGAGIVVLEVRRSNIPAIALYHKLGFVQIGERKNYYAGEDALVFAMDLGNL